MARGLLALMLSLFWVPAQAPALVIDTFDDAAVATANALPVTQTVTATTPSGSFLGSNRELTASWTGGTGDVMGEIDAGNNGRFSISLDADTEGTVDVLWQNIGGADLTEGGAKNAIAIQILLDDLPTEITLIATDTGANTGIASFTAPGGIFSPTAQTVFFSSFSGSVDFTLIESFQLVVAPNFPSADLQLDFIESTAVPVPEPATALLLAAGLLGLALRRRALR